MKAEIIKMPHIPNFALGEFGENGVCFGSMLLKKSSR